MYVSRVLSMFLFLFVLLFSTNPALAEDNILYLRSEEAVVGNFRQTEVFNSVNKHNSPTELWMQWKGDRRKVFGGPQLVAGSPNVSPSGKWIAWDVTDYTGGTNVGNPKLGAYILIASFDLETGQVGEPKRITPTGNVAKAQKPSTRTSRVPDSHWIHPCWVDDNTILCVSTYDGYQSQGRFSKGSPRMYRIDNVHAEKPNIKPLLYRGNGWELHPKRWWDGKIAFSTGESAGIRDIRLSGIWTIHPDGSNFQPEDSAFYSVSAKHTHTPFVGANGERMLAISYYYNKNNNGFGGIVIYPHKTDNPTPWQTHIVEHNKTYPVPGATRLKLGSFNTNTQPFARHGWYSMTGIDQIFDKSSKVVDGKHVGKQTHPEAAPDGIYFTWSGPTPSNNLRNKGTLPGYFENGGKNYDPGIYRLPASKLTKAKSDSITTPDEYIKVVDDPGFYESYPVYLGPQEDVWGEKWKRIPDMKNKGMDNGWLKPGSPYAIAGTGSLINRSVNPGWPTNGRATTIEKAGKRWFRFSNSGLRSHQGTTTGPYRTDQIWGLRFYTTPPRPERYAFGNGFGDGNYFNAHGAEARRWMGDVKMQADGSIAAKVPANIAMSFDLLIKDEDTGEVFKAADNATWHDFRPGEFKVDCGGCHAHDSDEQVPFEGTLASQLKVEGLADITDPSKHKRYEFIDDIWPILKQKCGDCHGDKENDALPNLVDDTEVRLSSDQRADNAKVPQAYRTLADVWRTPGSLQASPYVAYLNPRASMLVWKLYNKRLDGWANTDRGDDIDFSGAIDCTAHEVATPEEKRKIALWIDLGCLIDIGKVDSSGRTTPFHANGDATRPTINFSRLEAEKVIVGVWDHELDKVEATLDGQAISLTPMSDDRYSLPIPADGGFLSVKATDKTGNWHQLDWTYTSFDDTDPGPDPGPDPDPDECEELKKEIVQLKLRIKELEGELEDSNEENSDLKKTIVDLRKENSDLEEENTNLKKTIVDLGKEVSDLKKLVVDLTKEVEDLKDKLEKIDGHADSIKELTSE